MSNDYVIDVRDISKSFNGKPAVASVSLQVKRGEIFGFLGPNGSGKTTTIRMLCGLMTPDAGSGQCLGFDIIKDSADIKRLIGYVPQLFSLYQDLTVRENLEFIARVYGYRDYAKRTAKIMDEMALTPYKDRLCARLSGGWKQRVSLGAALIHEPKLLLLDEPTAGVDPKARRDFWNYVTQFCAEGISSLVTTHYMDEAERCNRLAYIMYGHMLADGTVDEIIKKSKLIAWAAEGSDLPKAALAMRGAPGVLQVVVLGNELRICGLESQKLEEIKAHFPAFSWRQVKASLEEVFIYLESERRYE